MNGKLAEIYSAYRIDIEENIKPENAGGYSFVWGFGNENADVCLIGEAPGRDEVEKGRPFVGKAGAILDEFLLKTGIEREKLFITNTIKYRLARAKKGSEKTLLPELSKLANRPARADEILRGAELLVKEINIIKPKIVVTMGNVPLKAMLSFENGTESGPVGRLHGIAINMNSNGFDYVLYPIYHPASLIYNRSLSDVYENDLRELNKLVTKVTGF